MISVYGTRYTFGILILLIQFASIGLYFALGFEYQRGPNAVSDVVAGAATIFPLTATYALTFVRYVVANPVARKKERRMKFDTMPFLVQLFIILIFGASLLWMIWFLFKNEMVVGGYQNIKIATAFLQTMFGSYLALIFGTLFPVAWQAQQAGEMEDGANVDGAQPAGGGA